MAWAGARGLLLCGSFVVLVGCDGCDESDPRHQGGHGGQGGEPSATGGQGGEPSPTGGGGGGVNEGGAGGEGGGSASPVDVTVTVVDAEGMPFESVDLIASAADGAIADQGTTDASGAAVLSVPPGGFVSMLREQTQVFWRPPTSRTLYETRTFAIEPGRSALQIRTPRDETVPPANAPMTALSIDVTAIPTATKYRLMLSCREDETLNVGANAVADYEGCPGESTFDATLAAMDAENHTLAFAFALDMPFTSGQSASLPLVLGSAPLTPVSFEVNDPDAVVSNILAGAYGLRPSKDPLWADGVDLPQTLPNNEVGFPATYPGPDCWLAFGNSFVTASELRVWQLFQCAEGTPGDLVWNVDRLGPATLSIGPTGSASIELLDGDVGDGVLMQTTWSDSGAGDAIFQWTVALPPPAASIAVPRLELPTDLVIFTPPLAGYGVHAINLDLLESAGDFIDVLADTIPGEVNLKLGQDLAGTSISVP